MARIKLIVTGDMEKLALAESLQRLFPSERGGKQVVWDRPHKINCTTGHRLHEDRDPSSAMHTLARAMLAEAGIGKRGQPADLIVAIDDVELGNLDREHVIADHVRAALESQLETHSAGTQNLDARPHSRCPVVSFASRRLCARIHESPGLYPSHMGLRPPVHAPRRLQLRRKTLLYQ